MSWDLDVNQHFQSIHQQLLATGAHRHKTKIIAIVNQVKAIERSLRM